MTDSLKLAEMQRTSIEFERQRHLANWFIKSSPHMANPQIAKTPNVYPDAANIGQKSMMNISNCAKNNVGTITTTNPLFFVMNGSHPVGYQKSGNSSNGVNIGGGLHHLSSIGAVHHQEGHKPKLRRFNSHDTSTNMFSVADFENARLARRNEIEMKQRLQNHKMKLNSLSSGGDCSTGDSKGSKYSSDSQNDPLQADLFLDRYSLPRIVKISYKSKFCQETLQSSFSNGSSTTHSSLASSDTNKHNTNTKQNSSDITKPNGELFLLHRYLKQRKIYHALNAKTSGANRKKGIKIPQEYPGYFSLINEKGAPTATLYSTLIQLVRERVYKFISVDNLAAFTESLTGENYSGRPHYVKTNTRGGQIFRLLAVFEDGKQEPTTTTSKTINNLGREKEKGRYAQLLNENRQILYVSLSAKGKFYEIEPGIPQLLQKVSKNDFPKKLNPDCVHRITTLINSDKTLPIQLKFISGPIYGSNATLIPENITITKISTEDVIIGCPIDNFETQQSQLHLGKIIVTPEISFLKCFLGFESEQRMLANQNVQNILKFCQFNCEQFLKNIEVEILNNPERMTNKNRNDGLKILKPLNFPKLLRRERSTIAHEKEDSIIFLSKNDLAIMETKEQQEPISHHNRITERMKVFQSTKKKWFRRSDKNTTLTSFDIDAHSKRMSMERYNDMSKLVQERFGEMLEDTIVSSERPISEIGVADAKPKTHIIQKSLSLQEVDFASKRETLPNKFRDENATSESLTQIDQTIGELSEQQQPICDINEVESESKEKLENQRQSSFITEKLYSEFHVKTRQYSKSSSSLHQLLHFSVPQKMNVMEAKKINPLKEKSNSTRAIDFSIGDCVSHRDCTSSIGLVDDLPYSSVRDSLLINEKVNRSDKISNKLYETNFTSHDSIKTDCIKENIYAEICHENQLSNSRCNAGSSSISRIQINSEMYSGHNSAFDQESSSLVECKISSSNEEDTDNENNYASSLKKEVKSIKVTPDASKSDDNNINNNNIYNTLK